MIVCICERVSDREIQAAIEAGSRSVSDIQRRCRAGGDCGSCCRQILQLLQQRREGGSTALLG